MHTILIIDDDEQFRAYLFEILDREGYNVVEAGDGAQGLALYRDQPTDLVITDLIMPEKEGMETIMELRREYPSARIIAISGGARISPFNFLSVAGKLGALRTLAKPFSRQEILEAVRETLAA